ncbi:hypothetical protein C1O40_07985 [Akkermansia muciniphila]|nr:hypothetical protein C1O40_07985 [Akkermansia muciniphila]
MTVPPAAERTGLSGAADAAFIPQERGRMYGRIWHLVGKQEKAGMKKGRSPERGAALKYCRRAAYLLR